MKSVNATIASLALLGIMAGPALAQSAGSDEMKGRHAMQGQITSLDEKKGWVHVKTDEGTMILRVPPESLRNVKKGDTVTVRLALKDTGPAKTKQ
ncbi:MAG TPA: hypothetical protein VL948_15030 [Verrucomicrobiae bacterium]|nr:hypothetical protein [Verrucomicrobiae bacterium]